eukprot:1226845-Prymnesium_polylepis.1
MVRPILRFARMVRPILRGRRRVPCLTWCRVAISGAGLDARHRGLQCRLGARHRGLQCRLESQHPAAAHSRHKGQVLVLLVLPDASVPAAVAREFQPKAIRNLKARIHIHGGLMRPLADLTDWCSTVVCRKIHRCSGRSATACREVDGCHARGSSLVLARWLLGGAVAAHRGRHRGRNGLAGLHRSTSRRLRLLIGNGRCRRARRAAAPRGHLCASHRASTSSTAVTTRRRLAACCTSGGRLVGGNQARVQDGVGEFPRVVRLCVSRPPDAVLPPARLVLALRHELVDGVHLLKGRGDRLLGHGAGVVTRVAVVFAVPPSRERRLVRG